MKNTSSSLIHRINNHLGVLLSSVEAMEANVDNHEYLKEIITEIAIQKDVYKETLNEVKARLKELEA